MSVSVSIDSEYGPSTSNPNDFWQKIKSLGPRKDSSIPIEIIDENGTPIRNEHEVLNRWKSDFEKLYNGTDTGNFDDIHYRQCLNHKEMIERRNEDPLYTPNALMNRNISIEEISSIIMKAKSGSAQGFDRIPYDVLKFPAVIAVLNELFQLIFECSIIPLFGVNRLYSQFLRIQILINEYPYIIEESVYCLALTNYILRLLTNVFLDTWNQTILF